MISAITGELRRVEKDRIHLACGPMMYEILVPAADVEDLRASEGESVTFHTIFDLEGDATRGGLTPRLIGFLREQDKRFFELFITVKGIGPKRALRAFVQPAGQIAEAIESKNTRFLVTLPEIGKRTAEQVVAELAGKMTEFAMAGAETRRPASTRPEEQELAIAAAVQLGVMRAEAERLIERAVAGNSKLSSSQELLREMFHLRAARA